LCFDLPKTLRYLYQLRKLARPPSRYCSCWENESNTVLIAASKITDHLLQKLFTSVQIHGQVRYFVTCLSFITNKLWY